MHLRDRILVAQPAGLPNTLTRAAQRHGATALVDATVDGWQDQLDGLDTDRLALRVDLDHEPTGAIGLAILTHWHLTPAHQTKLQEAVDAWQATGTPVAVEVRTRAEARRAKQAGCDVLVARGCEGPGRVSTRSNLVLLPQLAKLDVPIIAWGGAGPNATAALLVHAEAVVLDAQLYLLDEAGLPEAWYQALSAFDGGDVRGLGKSLEEPFHLFARIAEQHVHDLWEAEQTSELGERGRRRWLRDQLDQGLATWATGPREGLHPIGHDAAHATFFAQLGSLDDVLTWLEARIETQLGRFPLTEGSPLAQAHGTRYPVVQGAMANVSEVPAFAKAVADAGGLPFLAFASLREHWAEEALTGTIEALDEDQPFGCGIIGLDVNAKKRDAHLRLIKEHKPPMALIAAGTAEQALDLEKSGVDTYLHTPSQGIVTQALDMGLDRVVVEGNECGGHIGKLPSLVLWDLALQTVEAHDRDIQLLLAGGIGDEASAAMAGTLAAGVENAKVGCLMGTAYLTTREIVETGAITEAYQRLVLASKTTQVTGETVGIRARSAPTPFTEHVVELERQLVREGKDIHQRKEVLEHENLGATRIAARGLKRGEDGDYHEVPTDEQLHEGNYLMGQGAENLDDVITIQALHQQVTDHAQTRVQDAATRLSSPLDLTGRAPKARSEDGSAVDGRAIAVVGLGCVLPDAPDVPTFWQNLLDGRVSIRDLPEGRWPVDQGAHLHDGPDGTYTVLGGFIDEDQVPFDPIAYRIPPTVADQMDASQKWAITAVDQALQDAGLDEHEARDRWAVILGNAQGGEQRAWTDRRLALAEVEAAVTSDDALDPAARERVVGLLRRQRDALPAITEDTMPGELSNVIAGRVCSVFDIGGPARTVDAACASSLAAVDEAVSMLRDGTVDVAITGGVDRSMDPSAYAKFSAIGALSQDGSFPFDQRASGFVMGEGCGILVLKRLADAVEDGDRIYATLHGVGASSDGKGKGITAPNPSGQVRAIQAALQDAGWTPEDLGLIEAHGTGTPVGDPAEAETMNQILAESAPGSVGLGSVKGNIGHLKAAAGAAGLLKATLAIHHGVLPPTVVQDPTDKVDWSTSPLKLVTEPAPWTGQTRRAGVSAFGFGGTNAHVLLAEPPQVPPRGTRARAEGAVAGLRCVSGASQDAVRAALEEDEATWAWDAEDPVRLVLTPEADLATAEKAIAGELPPELALRQGVVYLAEGEAGSLAREDGPLAMVFPGQGSQYAGMLLDLADAFPAAQEVLDEADQVLTPLIGTPLSDLLALEGEEGIEAITPTEVCQPAVLTCDIAVLRTLQELGVEPDVVAGHSLGEYAALVAADVLSFEDALHAVSARGREMADVEVDDPGGLIALRTDRDGAMGLLDGLEAWPANVNGPEQTVVAGTTPALETIQTRAEEAGIQASRLPVSAAFHSPIVAPATEPLKRVLDRLAIDPPRIPVISNVTGQPYPEDPDEIRALLADQVASPVEWVATMERLDEMGTALIVEAGPKRAMSGLAQANLPHVPAVPTLHPRTGERQQFAQALALLAAAGRLPSGTLGQRQVAAPGGAAGQPVRPVRRSPADRTERARPQAGRSPKPAPATPRVVVSGVSVGLPGQADPFDPEGVARLLNGENRIQPVDEAAKDQMVQMHIQRLDKQGQSGPELVPIEDPDQVVQLAGRLSEIDLTGYDVTEDWIQGADPTATLAVGAALNALTDAKIPLVRETRQTSTGAVLEDGWVLPEPLQAETGVILASAFPGYTSLLEEAKRRFASARPTGPAAGAAGGQRAGEASTGRDAVVSYLADLLPRLEGKEDREEALRLLTELNSQPTSTGQPTPAPSASNGQPDQTRAEGALPSASAPFPRDFLFRALALGHAQVAQLLRARGPNLQVNAACASTTAALALAQDWIEQGRCQRVLVLGADVAGSQPLLPWVGAGFLSAGAASTEKRVEEAALPFDARRDGMLIGSGAVGLVVETAEAAADRGVTPLAELVGTHVANSAYHGARLNAEHVAEETRAFLQAACQRLGQDAQALAGDLVFVSHEPATPARGGSAEAEVGALRQAFGEQAQDVLITNTKGLTGHAMGAGIEDGIAVELLRARRAPPIANLSTVDPSFRDLTFSQGGTTERRYALRFAAGFGSQLALALFERTSPTPGAVDQASFEAWLARTVDGDVHVETRDRLLRIVPSASGPTGQGARPSAALDVGQAGEQVGEPAQPAPTSQPAPAPVASTSQPTASAPKARSDHQVLDLLVDLVSRKTGYPADVIDPEMDLEGDLGVDTVKQAEVLAEARKELGIPTIEGLSLSDVPTLQQAADLLAEHLPGDASPTPSEPTSQPTPTPSEPTSQPTASAPKAHSDHEVLSLLIDLVSRKTGYPADVIDPEMDLEGDLGVDTVKQAEVLAEARKELGIPTIEGLSLSDVPTLQQAADLLAEHMPASETPTSQPRPTPPEPTSQPPTSTPKARPPAAETEIGLRRVVEKAANAAPRLPAGTRVHLDPSLPGSLGPALEALEAEPVETEAEADLVVLPARVGTVEDLADRLTELQGIDEGTRVVLLAQGDQALATGLPALTATLTAEGRRSRAVLVAEPVTEERLARELLADTDESIVLGQGTRTTQAIAPGPAPSPEALDLEPGSVVLAPGGLGAAVWPCLAALAKDRELRIAVIGRSPIDDPGLDPEDEAAIDALRQELLQDAREEGPVRPAEIEAQVQATVARARKAQALARLEEHAQVLYLQADATDDAALRDVVDQVTETWAAPRLVVHGTGVERSRAFAQKTREEMTTVLSAKLAPVISLAEHLPQAHHVAFGSVAGVFGNPGQADYALANGALTGVLAPVEGTVIHWTAWEAPGGMADKESVRTVLEERGVAYLPVDQGAELFAQHAGRPGVFTVTDAPAEAVAVAGPQGHTLDVAGDEAWLVDHTVAGTRLFPGVRHLQALAEAARAHGPEPRAFSEVRFRAPLRIRGPTTLDLVLDGDQAATQVDGRVHATCRLAPGEGTKPLDPPTTLDPEVQADAIYGALFHGPSFQVLTGARVQQDRAEATADLTTGGGAPWALAIEAAMQAAGLAGAQGSDGELALPTAIEEVSLGQDPSHGAATVVAEPVARDLLGTTWDATVFVDDEPFVVLRALRLQRVRALTRFVEAGTELGPSGTRVKLEPVAPHEPRDPRAKRSTEQAAGQAAGEQALYEAHGRDVELTREEDGRPVSPAPGGVSISHAAGLAIAVAHPDHEALGVDLEVVTQRSAAWQEESFTQAEAALIEAAQAGGSQAATATVLWTLKEAAAKAIGTGLTVPTRELQVTELGQGRARVETPQGPVQATWHLVEGAAVSVAWAQG